MTGSMSQLLGLLPLVLGMLPFASKSSDEAADRAVHETLVGLAPEVRAWVFRYVGPIAELDDFVQEAMIELVRALDRFRGESSLKTYARRVVMRSVAAQTRRYRRRTRNLVPVPDLASVSNPERTAVTQQDIRRLYRAMSMLSEKRRNAVVLVDLEGLSHQEAADVEGVKISALRARLKFGRADLRRLLQDGPVRDGAKS